MSGIVWCLSPTRTPWDIVLHFTHKFTWIKIKVYKNISIVPIEEKDEVCILKKWFSRISHLFWTCSLKISDFFQGRIKSQSMHFVNLWKVIAGSLIIIKRVYLVQVIISRHSLTIIFDPPLCFTVFATIDVAGSIPENEFDTRKKKGGNELLSPCSIKRFSRNSMAHIIRRDNDNFRCNKKYFQLRCYNT